MDEEKKPISIYAINAGYRKEDYGVRWYYVQAYGKAEAEARFKNRINWLKVYQVVKCTDDKAEQVRTDYQNGKCILF